LAAGSGSMEFWKDLGGGVANPQAAVAFGLATPGTAATSDMVFSTYTPATAWNERMRLTNDGRPRLGTGAPRAAPAGAGNGVLPGVSATNGLADGVFGSVSQGAFTAGVHGVSNATNGNGLFGEAYIGANAFGVFGQTNSGRGVVGQANSAG